MKKVDSWMYCFSATFGQDSLEQIPAHPITFLTANETALLLSGYYGYVKAPDQGC